MNDNDYIQLNLYSESNTVISFEVIFTVQNKLKDFRVSRDS